jgi:hypothetical protein
MELRRLGLAIKVLIVVPSDILEQFAEKFQHLYPLAKLLVPSKDDFSPARRNEFFARIATGDWDAVIVAQPQFTLVPVNPETEAEFVQRELTGYREALSEIADQARAGDYGSTAPDASSDDALGGSDAGQAGDIQALVAALGAAVSAAGCRCRSPIAESFHPRHR